MEVFDIKLIVLSRKDAENLFRNYGADIKQDGKPKIHPIEALYFIERGKLKIKNKTFDSLKKEIKEQEVLGEEKYLVLKHLRQRGYILRFSFSSDEWLRIYSKGFRPGEDRTRYLLKIIKPDWKPKLNELLEDIEKAGKLRKELVYVFVKAKEPVFLKLSKTAFN